MPRVLLPVFVASLAACAPANADMEPFKQQVIEHAPVKHAIAASSTFFFCEEAPEKSYDILCEACEVSLHDIDKDGEITHHKAWATHFYYELKPWEEGERPRISTVGERGTNNWETKGLTPEAARSVWEKANNWCQARGDGEFHMLKDSIDVWFAERQE